MQALRGLRAPAQNQSVVCSRRERRVALLLIESTPRGRPVRAAASKLFIPLQLCRLINDFAGGSIGFSRPFQARIVDAVEKRRRSRRDDNSDHGWRTLQKYSHG